MEKRIEENAATYKTNYLIVLVVVFLLGLLTSPFLLFVVLLCVALWCACVKKKPRSCTLCALGVKVLHVTSAGHAALPETKDAFGRRLGSF